MKARLHRLALRTFRALPVWARRRVVRTIAPGFTVGSMCFIERADGALLLVRLSYRERWGVPGGLLQKRESPQDAARREVLEEVGIAIEVASEPAVVVDVEAQRVDLIFRAVPAEGVDPSSAVASSPEILEARWFPADDLPALQHETSGALVALARWSSGARPVTGSDRLLRSPATTPGGDDEPSRGDAAS